MESYCSLRTLDTIHRLFFVTRLIINKVQWVDFKLENVLVSLHSLKTMGLGSIILRNGELLGHSPIRSMTTYFVSRNQRVKMKSHPKFWIFLSSKIWIGYFFFLYSWFLMTFINDNLSINCIVFRRFFPSINWQFKTMMMRGERYRILV